MAARTKKTPMTDDAQGGARRGPESRPRSSAAISKRWRRTSRSGAGSAPPTRVKKRLADGRRPSSRPRPGSPGSRCSRSGATSRSSWPTMQAGTPDLSGAREGFREGREDLRAAQRDLVRRLARVRRAARGLEEGRHHPRLLPERDLTHLPHHRLVTARLLERAEVLDQRVTVGRSVPPLRGVAPEHRRRRAPRAPGARRHGRARVRSPAGRASSAGAGPERRAASRRRPR